MRLQFWARWGLLAVTAIVFLAISACGTREPDPAVGPTGGKATASADELPSQAGQLKDEIPSSELAAVMAAHYRGLGNMERYEYRRGHRGVSRGAEACAGWIPGSINLAIALLNDSGVKAEEAKKSGVTASSDNFGESLELLSGVLERDARQPLMPIFAGASSSSSKEAWPRRTSTSNA